MMDILITTSLFIISMILVVIASKSHMTLLRTRVRNFNHQMEAERAIELTDSNLKHLKDKSESFNKVFAQLQIKCINDPSIPCSECYTCRRGEDK